MKLYLFAKKIHRYLMLGILFSTMLMVGTGSVLKYPELFRFVDYDLARYLHSQLSLLFSIFLVLMAASGILLYVVPLVVARRKKKQAEQDN